jgi:hypothetical protein
MSTKTPVRLQDRSNGKLCDASLVMGLGKEEIDATEAEWQPFLQEQLARLAAERVPKEKWPQHVHWSWREKQKATDRLLAYQLIGVECGSQMQGLMLVATAGRYGRLDSQKGRPLVYIHYLATAPWNSPLVVVTPRYALVGSVLLAAAIQLSIEEEFSGRVGLHSLPQADGWYAKCGMTDLGPDDTEKQHLRYFEMTSEQAKAFLN